MNLIDLANEALGEIGESTITDLDGTDNKSQLCKRFIGEVDRKGVLGTILDGHDWNFARGRVAIAADATTPVSGFAFQYTLPADCLRVRRLNGDHNIPFKVEGRKILTDEASPIIIEYTRYISDINFWGPSAYQAAVKLLASKLAGPLIDRKTAKEILEEYFIFLPEAKAIDGQEGIIDAYESPDLTTDIRTG